MTVVSDRSTAHRRELLESRDEILIGEVIAAMADAGYPVIGIDADIDYQRIRFRTLQDDVLHSVVVAVDRAADLFAFGKLRSKATLQIQGEVKNYLASVDELLAAHQQRRTPSNDKIGYQHNSIFYNLTRQISLESVLDGSPACPQLQQMLSEAVAELKEKLAPFRTPQPPR